MRYLNLGVLAHVDAGKTTLTERLLYEAGAIRTPGSVDKGTTQTDTLLLERARGITIKSAVAALRLGDTVVNVIDTPGHPDFIAEVERVLSVLDGAVLVVSGTAGVQPQTQLMMRVLRRLRLPTFLFVNKLDRPAADFDEVVASITEHLDPCALAMGTVERDGPTAAFRTSAPGDDAFQAVAVPLLAEHDDRLLAQYVSGDVIPGDRVLDALVEQTTASWVHPVFGGSARDGVGVRELMDGLQRLLRPAATDGGGAPVGQVFKVDRLDSGERVTLVRMREGTLRTRDRVVRDDRERDTITSIEVAEVGGWQRREVVDAGQIARLHGVRFRVGDVLGDPTGYPPPPHLASPMLEAVIRPRHPQDSGALSAALAQLADQDPLIEVRHDDFGELVVSLFGDVQREVLASTIAEHYGLDVVFDESRPVCIERPSAEGHAVELLEDLDNPYSATLALRIAPGPQGSGIEVRLRARSQRMPLHIYKSREKFLAILTGLIERRLRAGLFGWEVTDCVVEVTDCDYLVADGPRPPGKADTSALDFRRLTPIVVGNALLAAGTTVCEPVAGLDLELPAASLSETLTMLARLGGTTDVPELAGGSASVRAYVRVARLHEVRRQLVDATGGYGVVEVSLAGYAPVRGDPPTRPAVTTR